MKIYQLVPALTYGDAIGNDAVALYKLITEMGYETKIYAQGIGPRIPPGIAEEYTKLPKLTEQDVLIYHMATSSEIMVEILQSVNCKKVMIYHNITPPDFFEPYNLGAFNATKQGLEELKKLKNTINYCMADSSYNKQDLLQIGYSEPIGVLPILLPLGDYDKQADQELLTKYANDGWTNILFVGRVVPNKKQEDVIKCFAYYKKHFNAKARLFIVGNYNGMETYYNKLVAYIKTLGVSDVIFTGHTTFAQILSYYRLADVFLCMSEHEGFCVPLVEAMKFKVPVIAYASSAIPETLNGCGILVHNKNSVVVAKLIDRLIKDESLRSQVIAGEQQRLQDFSYEKVASETKAGLQQMIGFFQGTLEQAPEGRLSLRRKVPKEISTLIQSLEIETTDQGDFDWSNSFAEAENCVVNQNQVNVATHQAAADSIHYKQFVKQKVLKRGYRWIRNLNPDFAERMRNTIYNVHENLMGKHHQEIVITQPGTPVTAQERPDKIIIEPSLFHDGKAYYVDVTITTRFNLGTGIQRVVNNVWKNIQQKCTAVPVRKWQGQLITSNKYLSEMQGTSFQGKENLIKFQKGDVLFLLDSSWDFYREFADTIEEAHKNGAVIWSVVYDLIPILYPELVINKLFKENFTHWQELVLQQCDGILCISRTTADYVIQYYNDRKLKRNKPLQINYFHMGFNIPSNKDVARDTIKKFVQRVPTFLMVGTVEPRKGHAVALAAFKKIFQTQIKAQLLIIGQDGWKNDEFLNALHSDEDMSAKIMWVSDATDEELQWAYKNTCALIAASKDEGFGLPLIEAAHFGLPIICSDIPIFREVAGENATYFKVMDADALKETVITWLKEDKHPDSRNIKLYTWAESAQEILDILDGKVQPYTILQ